MGGIESNFSESLRCFYEPELVEKCAWTCGACKEHRFDRPKCQRPRSLKPAAIETCSDLSVDRSGSVRAA